MPWEESKVHLYQSGDSIEFISKEEHLHAVFSLEEEVSLY